MAREGTKDNGFQDQCGGLYLSYHTTPTALRTMKSYLKAVFWDYPSLTTPENIKKVLQEARDKNQRETIYWIMTRFLERGRVRDTAIFFRPKEIKESLDSLKLSSRARKRWERLLEVYGDID